MKMGLREANQKFSQAIQAVKSGEEVVLTERGTPIAVIKPLNGTRSGEAVIRQLEAGGLLRPPSKHGPLPAWTPRRIKGGSLVDTLRKERAED